MTVNTPGGLDIIRTICLPLEQRTLRTGIASCDAAASEKRASCAG